MFFCVFFNALKFVYVQVSVCNMDAQARVRFCPCVTAGAGVCVCVSVSVCLSVCVSVSGAHLSDAMGRKRTTRDHTGLTFRRTSWAQTIVRAKLSCTNRLRFGYFRPVGMCLRVVVWWVHLCSHQLRTAELSLASLAARA